MPSQLGRELCGGSGGWLITPFIKDSTCGSENNRMEYGKPRLRRSLTYNPTTCKDHPGLFSI